MDDNDDVMKQAAIVMTRLAKLLSGECKECIHCGQPVEVIRQGERSVYVRREDEFRCINPIEVSLDGKEFWCRQYQGKVPDE
jgi:hypothetical protein